MLSPFAKALNKRQTLLICLLLAGLYVGVAAAAARLSLGSSDPDVSPPAAAAPVRENSPQPRVEVLRIALRPTGFDPATLKAPPGRTLLAVDDLSGLDEVTLRLDREAGGRLREVKAGRDSAKWRGVFNLRPGEYTLSVEGRPGWVCRITVTAD